MSLSVRPRRFARLAASAPFAAFLALPSASPAQTIHSGNLYVGNENSYDYLVPDIDGDPFVTIDTPTIVTGNVFVSDHDYLVRDYSKLTVASSLQSAIGYVGYSPNGAGLARVTGTDSSWTTTDILYIGHTGFGYLEVGAGAHVSSQGGYVGFTFYSDGTVTLSDSGSAWTNTGAFHVAHEGAGELHVLSGATFTTDSFVLAGNADQFKRAIFEVADATADTGATTIADLQFSQGQASVSGATGHWTTTTLTVGATGSARLDIEDGGHLTSSSATLGLDALGAGQVTLSGAGSRWDNAGQLRLGALGSGVLVVGSGATVDTSSLVLGPRGRLELHADSTLRGALTFAGGTLAAAGFDGSLDSVAITADTTLDFGELAAALAFADSSLEDWTGQLLVTGYSPGIDTLRFGDSSESLTLAQLALIDFVDLGHGAAIDSAGFVTPSAVPEPATTALVTALLILAATLTLHRPHLTPYKPKQSAPL